MRMAQLSIPLELETWRINSSEKNKPQDKIDAVKKWLAQYESALKNLELSIIENENYLRDNGFMYHSESVDKYRRFLNNKQNEYNKLRDRYTLEMAELQVEQKKYTSKVRSYRELIWKTIHLQDIPKESVLETEDGIFYIRSIKSEGHYLIIEAFLAEFPKCRMAINKIYASANGESLGLTERILPKNESWHNRIPNDSGSNTSLKYRIDLKNSDIHIPSEGDTIKISITGLNINNNISFTLNSATSPFQNEVEGTAISLRGKRKGNHILLPLTIKTGGVEIERECMLDTGASITTVYMEDHDKLKFDRVASFKTANGIVSLPVVNSHVRSGEMTRIIDIAFSKSSELNLLGANFFSGYIYSIDIENASIYLIKR